ncbi:DNA mismatch repair protein MutS [Amphritea opalescens]|uniref:DNA mismatch repair protein MutS n=1 Tax=Amphritea opalescens TaxID=2490544 RepID=A0A430KW71_9GAMM|nr:Smr/MutS family protein [Amphritea opalescens]RTE67573.1 DNA mismatch repair protein MutS [Amphritea opalescens]
MSDNDLPNNKRHNSGASNDDNEIDFASVMQGVSRIKSDRADLRGQPKKLKLRDDETTRYKRQMAVQDDELIVDGLNSEVVNLVETNDELIFAAPGVQLKLMKRLKQGHVPWDAGLDLHGYTLDDARTELGSFIRECSNQQLRCVMVIHGKSNSIEGQHARMKSYVNDWLRQMNQVIAFSSAQPKDGGTGALYVLLKRANKAAHQG